MTPRWSPRTGNARGEIDLTVLGPVARTAPTREQLALANPNESATFGVLGYDERRRPARRSSPADVQLTYDRNLLDITPDADGQYTVKAKQQTGSGLVTIDVRGKKSVLPVTVGLTEVSVADFTDPTGWTFFGERATGAIAPVARPRRPGPAPDLRLHPEHRHPHRRRGRPGRARAFPGSPRRCGCG